MPCPKTLGVCVTHFLSFFAHAATPPTVTIHPQELINVVPGKCAKMTVQATGTDPLSYHWQWKPADEEGKSRKWYSCPAEWSDGTTLTLSSVHKSNEGSYRCVTSNCAGSQKSNTAQLSVGKNPTLRFIAM